MSSLSFAATFPGHSGDTLYFTIDAGGRRWNGTAFETPDSTHWPTYAVALAEAVAGSGLFTGTVPAALAAWSVALTFYQRAGATAAADDNPVGSGRYAPGPPAAVNATDGAFTVQRNDLAGSTVYGVFDSPAALRWNGTGFEPIDATHWPTYAVAGSEVAGSGLFSVTIPVTIATAYVNAQFFRRAGATAAATDEFLGTGSYTLDAGAAAFRAGIAGAVAEAGVTLAPGAYDDLVVDSANGFNVLQVLSAMNSVLCGQCAIDGNTVTFKSPGSNQPRVIATTDPAGNRSVVNISFN